MTLVVIVLMVILSLFAPGLMSTAISGAIEGVIDFFFIVFEL